MGYQKDVFVKTVVHIGSIFVLKFITSIQLLAEYPLWHEGYLSRKKDHAVSNARLAKENILKKLYSWIIRDRLLGKKWKPSYFNSEETAVRSEVTEHDDTETRFKKKNSTKGQILSTKVLADVVESLIGAAYLHGGFDLGFECTRFFDLGLKWEPIPTRIDQLLKRVDGDYPDLPPSVALVERMIGYTFRRKLLVVEALTHASFQEDLRTISYERMEFLGDSALDMIVTDYLYRAPGKEYSPGHIFLRKSAMVNAHILAYICLRSHVQIDASMPTPTGSGRGGGVALVARTQDVYLWQCLLHSSPRVLDDQRNTLSRYRLRHAEIEASLKDGMIFPWAALTRLQAPKFFSDMVESLMGAVYLDSHGNLDAVRQVMGALGLMQLLERIVRDNVDVLHPVSRMGLWAQKNGKKLEYRYPKNSGNITCEIFVDGEEVEEASSTDIYRGKATKEEMRLAAAEKAIKIFHLRDVNVSYAVLKRKTSSQPKQK